MKYRNILFDFDGTLVDSSAAIRETINATLKIHGLDNISSIVKGTRTRHAYQRFADTINPDTLRETHKSIQHQFFPKYSIFPDVASVLQQLKDRGCRLAIITTANRPKVIELLKIFNIYHLFDTIVAESDVTNTKPDIEPFIKAFANLKLTDSDKPHTLMVGDSDADFVGAQNFNIDVVAVTYSTFDDSPEEYNSTYTIDKFTELLPIVGGSP